MTHPNAHIPERTTETKENAVNTSVTPEPKRKTPTDFAAVADTYNARTDEIAGYIVREHETHRTLRDEEEQRHAAQLTEYYGQQIDHALTRKALIGKAGEFGITAAHARAVLRKG